MEKVFESFLMFCTMFGFAMFGIGIHDIVSNFINKIKGRIKKRKEEKAFVANMPRSIGRVTDISQDECGDFIVTVKCSSREYGRLVEVINERSVYKDVG